MYTPKKAYFYGTGRRKSSVARVKLVPNGTGVVTINNRTLDNYFGLATLKSLVKQPLTLLGLSSAHQAAVIETGMNHFGEIEYLGAMVRPDVAVISNIGDAHIEFLGSRQGILQAKCEIFAHLKEGGLAVLNGDDSLLDTVDIPFRTVRCGQSEHCQARITEVADHGVEGITCTVATAKDVYHLVIPSPGV